jgi:hypothetical protein
MHVIRVSFFLFLLLFVQTAAAGDIRMIDLTDGSTITGDVLSVANGVYTIRSDSLGTVKLDASKIRAIRTKPSGTSPVSSREIAAMREKMLSDKDIVALIQSLQNDPDFIKALEDPAIMKAVSENDISTLVQNPRFMKLLNNATVKEIQLKAR